jgi:hypothetical protein
MCLPASKMAVVDCEAPLDCLEGLDRDALEAAAAAGECFPASVSS